MPIWLWLGVAALAVSLAVIALVFSGLTLANMKLQSAEKEVETQEQQIKQLRRQNQALNQQIEQMRETSKTLDQIKEKVFEINKRRTSLVKWAALPNRGGDWIGRIDRFLAGTPLEGQGRLFYLAAADAGIEPRLMPAIAMIESGAGRVNAYTYNFFGRRAVRGWASWPTKEAAIRNQARYISRMWGRVSSPYQMRGYATSPVWGAKVAGQMSRI